MQKLIELSMNITTNKKENKSGEKKLEKENENGNYFERRNKKG